MNNLVCWFGRSQRNNRCPLLQKTGETGEVRSYGTIESAPYHVGKLLKRLAAHGDTLAFCYEAGPCGYGLYRTDH